VNARLAFVAGEENNKLALIDLTNMQVLATYPVGKDPDVLAFDPGLKQLYVSAESGNVTVFREKGKTLVSMGGLFIPHAHTVSVDPETHLVCFPLQNIDGHPCCGSWNQIPHISWPSSLGRASQRHRLLVKHARRSTLLEF
jgi:hypothetical protein